MTVKIANSHPMLVYEKAIRGVFGMKRWVNNKQLNSPGPIKPGFVGVVKSIFRVATK